MKHDLIVRFGVPEEAIIVDPHARHTTTNMRNPARLMYRYGIPLDRKARVSTDLSQSIYIENPDFASAAWRSWGTCRTNCCNGFRRSTSNSSR
jgi:hypothetical protein